MTNKYTETHLSSVWTQLSGLSVERASGVNVFDQEGRSYLDFTSGIGVTNTGHSHPKVVEALCNQAPRFLFAQMNCVVNPLAAKLAKSLNDITPPGIDRFFFANSGAEATEAAVKLARAATGKTNIVVFQGSFHGRTHLSMAMTTSKTIYRKHYQPLPAGIFVAPYPYAFQFGWDEEKTVDFCCRQLELLFESQTAPSETAAIIIEPVQGEGGYIPAPGRFLHFLRKICDQHDILLIIDEVQSGFGRTGRMFCLEHSGVSPDIIVMAKGLGSGLPISAIGAGAEIMGLWEPGSHGGTYGGGSALACVAALATIEVIREEKLVEKAAANGDFLMSALRDLKSDFPCIGDVRGLGMMIATEFVTEEGLPDATLTGHIVRSCVERGLLLLSCGTYKNVIRWIPPLIVTKEELTKGLEIFKGVLIELKDMSL